MWPNLEDLCDFRENLVDMTDLEVNFHSAFQIDYLLKLQDMHGFMERSVTLKDPYFKNLKCDTSQKCHFIHARFACHENPK